MADKTTINIMSDDTSGKDLSKAITYINPNATNAQIAAFATGLNNLTTNHYQKVRRVDVYDIVGNGQEESAGGGD